MQPHTAAQVAISYYLDYLKRYNHLPHGWKSAEFEISDNIYNAKKDINRIKYYKFRCYPQSDRNLVASISGFRDCRATVTSKTEGYYEIQHGCSREVREEYRILPERVTDGRTLFSERHGNFSGHAVDEKRLVLSDYKTLSRHTVKIESARISKHHPPKSVTQSPKKTEQPRYATPEPEEYSEPQVLPEVSETLETKWSVQKMILSLLVLIGIGVLFIVLLVFSLAVQFLRG